MNLYGYEFQRDSDLAHYGVIGMKWGVRRYQNADGTLTAEGKKHAQQIRDVYDDRYDPKKESWSEYYQRTGPRESKLASEYAEKSGFLKEANKITHKLLEIDLGKKVSQWTDKDTQKLYSLYEKYMKSLDPILKEAKLSSEEMHNYKLHADNEFWERIYGFGY